MVGSHSWWCIECRLLEVQVVQMLFIQMESLTIFAALQLINKQFADQQSLETFVYTPQSEHLPSHRGSCGDLQEHGAACEVPRPQGKTGSYYW
jgi:hypothetical protein